MKSKWKVGDKVIFVAQGVCSGLVGTICEVDALSGRSAMQTRNGKITTNLWSDDCFEALSDDEWEGKVFVNHPAKGTQMAKKKQTHREEIIVRIRSLKLGMETAATGCDDILAVVPSDPADDVRAAADQVVNDLDTLLRQGKELLREISLLQQDEKQSIPQ